MMKKGLCGFLLLVVWTAVANAQGPGDDAAAVEALDRMSAAIGELGSCSFTLQTSRDVYDQDMVLVKRFSVHDVKMMGPDKMLVDSRTDNDHVGYWYDGKTVTYHSHDGNHYATVKAPDTILETIDAVNRDYGIDWPAADFFYPTFTDDLIEESDRIVFLGLKNVEGKECFHILATSKKTGIQLWIAADATSLPVKLCIADYEQQHTPQYETTFSNWKINPVLSAAMFEFKAPEAATQITLAPRSAK